MADFTMRVQPLGGGPLALGSFEFIGEIPFTTLTYKERLNLPGTIEFEVPREQAFKWDPNGTVGVDPYLSPGMVEVAVYDGPTCMWEGRLTSMSRSRSSDTITFLGEGVMAYLEDNPSSTISFAGRKSNEIFFDIIDDMQTITGVLGVDNIDTSLLVAGETHATSGVDWDVWGAAIFNVNFTEYKTHLALAKTFSGYRGGVDWYIAPGTRKATVVFTPIGYASDERAMTLHDDNTQNWDHSVDSHLQVGTVLVISRTAAGVPLEVQYTSSDPTALYAPTKKTFRRLSLETTEAATLEAYSLGAQSGLPQESYSFETIVDPFGDGTRPLVGEPIIARIGGTYDSEERALRVYGVDTTENKGGRFYTVYAEIANDFLGIV